MSKPSMYKKIVFAVFMLAASGVSAHLSALEFSLRPGGFVFFPAGPGNKAADGNERFDIGGGGGLGFDLNLIWGDTGKGLRYLGGSEECC